MRISRGGPLANMVTVLKICNILLWLRQISTRAVDLIKVGSQADVGTSPLIHFIFLSFAIFMASFFVIPNAVDQYKFFSVAVFLPGLFLVPRALRLLRGNQLFALIVIYLTYMLMTPAWGADFVFKTYFNDVRLALYLLIFVLIIPLLCKKFPCGFERLIRLMCILAAGAAVVSIVIWWPHHNFPLDRLVGVGTLEHPNPSAAVYGFFAVLAIGLLISEASLWLKIIYLLSIGILLSFLWLTQSRGALVATVMAFGIFFFQLRPKRMLIVLVSLTGITALVFFLFPQGFASLIERGTSSRLLIWSTVLSQAAETPFFGHGYLVDNSVFVVSQKARHAFAHNAYLASLRDGGVVGMALMLALLTSACRLALSIGREKGSYVYLALLVFGLVYMIFDTDRLITRPRELWVIFWLPLALILSESLVPEQSLSVPATKSAACGQP